MSIAIVNKEPLSDSLVNNDQSDVWRLTHLVVHLVNHFLELSDFLLDDLSSHSITYSVSVDDKVVREHLLRMSFFKCLDCLPQGFSQVCVYYLLSFLLEDLVRVVLAHF